MTWHPDMPEEYRNAIVTGDARELAKAIPDESIDLVFTDPIYQNIDDYRWLAETAARVLKPDSACLAFVANRRVWDTLNVMIPTLGFVKIISYHLIRLINGVAVNTFDDRSLTMWTPLLWLEKGHNKPSMRVWDYAFSQWGNSDLQHRWSKAFKPFINWIGNFTQDAAIVYDPFTGGGTVPVVCKMLGRNYVASEIDPDVAERARQRVLLTQPPLFVLQPEQLELEAL